MRVLPIIERLRERCPIYAAIDHALSLNALDDLDTDVPAAFVYSGGDESGPNMGMQRVAQDQSRVFGVITAAETGGNGVEPLEDARDQLMAALLGWEVNDACEPVVHARGEMIAINGRLSWWLDTFTFVEHIGS